MSEYNLKPCPFCGSEAEVLPAPIIKECYCANNICLICYRRMDSELWNLRPIEEKLESDLVILAKLAAADQEYWNPDNRIEAINLRDKILTEVEKANG